VHDRDDFDRCAIAKDQRIGKALDPALANAGFDLSIDNGVRSTFQSMQDDRL
jgi:hypothetical protein